MIYTKEKLEKLYIQEILLINLSNFCRNKERKKQIVTRLNQLKKTIELLIKLRS